MDYVISNKLREALEVIKTCGKAQMTSIVGYVPSSNYIEKPVVNVNFLSKISYANFKAKKEKNIVDMSINDVSLSAEKLKALDTEKATELFNVAKNEILNGVRKPEVQASINEFSHSICEGVSVQFKSEIVKGNTLLILDEKGRKIVESIKLGAIEIQRTTIKEGIKKVVKNSREKTLMKKAIEKASTKRGYVNFSLKEDNFDHLKIGGNILQVEELY